MTNLENVMSYDNWEIDFIKCKECLQINKEYTENGGRMRRNNSW